MRNYYKGQFMLRKELDLSNIPDNHQLFTNCSPIERQELFRIKKANKKVPGKFKDELCGKSMTCFVGLKPKLYSYKMDDGSESHRAKGVKKSAKLYHADYLDVVMGRHLKISRKQKNFISSRHDMFLRTIHKKCMDRFYDKRFVLEDFSTLAFGNRRIPALKAAMEAKFHA